MTATALLNHLRALGVEVRAEGEALRYRAPAGVLTENLRRELAAHKQALLSLVARYSPPVVLGPRSEDPLDFRRDPLTDDWVHEPGWWRRPAQVREVHEGRAPCPRCGGRRFWVSVCHSAICGNCYPPGPGEKALGWLVGEEEPP